MAHCAVRPRRAQADPLEHEDDQRPSVVLIMGRLPARVARRVQANVQETVLQASAAAACEAVRHRTVFAFPRPADCAPCWPFYAWLCSLTPSF